MSSPEFRVVVPTHDRRALALRLVRALQAQVAPGDYAEIVVVCDGCRDGTAAALRESFGAAITVLEQPRGGPGAARNLGAEGSGAECLLFVDDDMFPAGDLLARHRDVQRRIGGGLVIGALPVDEASPRSFVTEGLARWAARRDQRLRTPGLHPGFEDVLTGNLSVARRAFEHLGGFDAAFTQQARFGDEDLDFGWRAIASGVPIAYAPDALAWQTYDKTFRALADDVRGGAAADARLVAKHPQTLARLPAGNVDELPPWERRALRLSARHPAAGRALLAAAVLLLEQLRARGARGPRLEETHAVVRAGLYGLGLADAGAASLAASRSTS